MTEADASHPQDLHLLLTDSGLGGLAVCAGIERNLRSGGRYRRVRLTYFNAAPEPRRGYNDLPDAAARAALLDRALAAMEALHPDRIVLACNTLSVLYEGTAHARRHAARVTGIIEVGVGLFADALTADPGGVLLLIGTRTTIDSGAHRQRLIDRGLAADRIAAISCHGLAAAIDNDPDGPAVKRLIDRCAAALPGLRLAGRGERLYAGLACTHYAFVEQRIRAALQRASGLPVRLLDPNQALVEAVAPAAAAAIRGCGGTSPSLAPAAAAAISPLPSPLRGPVGGDLLAGTYRRGCGGTSPSLAPGTVTVQVLSKVPLEEATRRVIAERIAPVSHLTARALLSYSCDPDLF